MSAWRDQKNAKARAQLRALVPDLFPRAVLVHADGQSLVPGRPRLAIESYWRAHPVRADRLARALAGRGEAPADWNWCRERSAPGGLRSPPAPFREAAHHRGPGFCCICGQPVFRFGWHVDLWQDARPNRRAQWHACCVAAWKLWTAPAGQLRILRRLQRRRCALTGGRLLRGAEVDHRVPLHQVWRTHQGTPWPAVLTYWGFPNLQAVSRTAHASKTAAEAGARAGYRPGPQSAEKTITLPPPPRAPASPPGERSCAPGERPDLAGA